MNILATTTASSIADWILYFILLIFVFAVSAVFMKVTFTKSTRGKFIALISWLIAAIIFAVWSIDLGTALAIPEDWPYTITVIISILGFIFGYLIADEQDAEELEEKAIINDVQQGREG